MGQLIGNRYEIQAELGAGGMGTVFLGLDKASRQTVAIKQLKSEIVKPEIVERFKREGQALRDLNHPNIVKLLDALEFEGHQYLVMEYVTGGDLRQVLQNGKLPYQRCLNIAIDLADALTRAHRLNIIHRDLKPANVLIAEDGTIRLTDFGVAHIVDKERVTETDAIVGTLDYLPPEVLNGEAIEPCSDIWAFGVMLFEMLTGQRPFAGNGYLQTLNAIATAPIPDLEMLAPDAPIALVDLVYRCLARDPQARISSVRYIGAELEDILQGREKASRFETPIPDFRQRPKHNLPAQTTPFVGRESELAELSRLIHNRMIRLVCIIAQGGMGKTRLSLKAADRAIPYFEHGVFFVELAPLSDSSGILPAIAQALGYQFQNDDREPSQQICDYLQGKELLLVLDNFEHLLDGAGLVSDLLTAAPKLKILVTSRQRLDQSGESLFHLSGMDFPAWETPADALEYAAVKLFMNSASRARAEFELKVDNLEAVARICKLVQGMPLGIVLAASWLGMLSPEEVAIELQKGLDFLESDSQQIPERQRSMRAVMNYSWQQMSEAEQVVFAKLSVFRGGFTREAGEAIAGANLRILMSLINKSLLHRDSATGRYEIHELLRQYAEEHSDKQSNRDAHCAYFSKLLDGYEQRLITHRFFDTCHLMEADFENIRFAWQWSIEHNNVQALHMMIRSLRFFMRRFRRKDLSMIEEVWRHVQVNVDNERYYVRLLLTARASSAEDEQRNVAEALRIARKSGTQRDIAQCLVNTRGPLNDVVANLHEGLVLAEAVGDTYLQEFAYFRLGQIARLYESDIEKALKYYENAQTLAEKTGNPIISPSRCIADVKLYRGDKEGFLEYWLARFEESRRRQAIDWMKEALLVLIDFYAHEANFPEAWRYLNELTSYRELMGESVLFEMNIAALTATIKLLEGHYEEALEYRQEEAAYIESAAGKYHIQEEFRIFHKVGLLLIACGRGDYATLEQHFRSTLREVNQEGFRMADLVLMLIYQFVLVYQRRYKESVEIASLVQNHPLCLTVYKTFPLRQTWEKQVRAALSNEVYQAAWEHGKSLELGTVVQQILSES